MTLYEFIITIRHNRGKVRLRIFSFSGITDAIQQLCIVEGCPETAILSIRKIKSTRIQ